MGLVSRREPIRRLRVLGFDDPYSGGRQSFMRRGGLKLRIPNPLQGGEIGVPLLGEILRQAGITGKDWDTVG
ncbi:MAG: type II toxin-antitoxin system HicA family toxin [Bacillota bacterium]|nr:type II toxin-antitoxin system HicA family toxin [Bacillota bacterium]